MGFKSEQSGRFGVDDAPRPAHERIAEGFHADEIAHRTALFVPKRMIYPADMRVTMDGDDLAGEL